MKLSEVQKSVLRRLRDGEQCWAQLVLAYGIRDSVAGLHHYKFRSSKQDETVRFSTIWALRDRKLITTTDVFETVTVHSVKHRIGKCVVQLTKLGRDTINAQIY